MSDPEYDDRESLDFKIATTLELLIELVKQLPEGAKDCLEEISYLKDVNGDYVIDDEGDYIATDYHMCLCLKLLDVVNDPLKFNV